MKHALIPFMTCFAVVSFSTTLGGFQVLLEPPFDWICTIGLQGALAVVAVCLAIRKISVWTAMAAYWPLGALSALFSFICLDQQFNRTVQHHRQPLIGKQRFEAAQGTLEQAALDIRAAYLNYSEQRMAHLVGERESARRSRKTRARRLIERELALERARNLRVRNFDPSQIGAIEPANPEAYQSLHSARKKVMKIWSWLPENLRVKHSVPSLRAAKPEAIPADQDHPFIVALRRLWQTIQNPRGSPQGMLALCVALTLDLVPFWVALIAEMNLLVSWRNWANFQEEILDLARKAMGILRFFPSLFAEFMWRPAKRFDAHTERLRRAIRRYRNERIPLSFLGPALVRRIEGLLRNLAGQIEVLTVQQGTEVALKVGDVKSSIRALLKDLPDPQRNLALQEIEARLEEILSAAGLPPGPQPQPVSGNPQPQPVSGNGNGTEPQEVWEEELATV